MPSRAVLIDLDATLSAHTAPPSLKAARACRLIVRHAITTAGRQRMPLEVGLLYFTRQSPVLASIERQGERDEVRLVMQS